MNPLSKVISIINGIMIIVLLLIGEFFVIAKAIHVNKISIASVYLCFNLPALEIINTMNASIKNKTHELLILSVKGMPKKTVLIKYMNNEQNNQLNSVALTNAL